MAAPELVIRAGSAQLRGDWSLAALADQWLHLQRSLAHLPPETAWDLSAVERLDSAAACLLWQTWQQNWPQHLVASPGLHEVIRRVAAVPELPVKAPAPERGVVERAGVLVMGVAHNLKGLTELVGQLILDLGYLLRHPGEFPWRELSANLYRAGAQALPVSALVGFLIGITISYLSALQLKNFGADQFVINILGIGIIRELGPVLVAVLVAGRSGSAMTAQIGVMRVTEEIDALATLGISRSQRLVLPKVMALSIAMPLLVLWSSTAAMVGGMLAAYWQLDLSFAYFLDVLPRAVPFPNLIIGMAKGWAFGVLIALVACHFGLHVKPNTESLAARTTTSVVASITLVILVDAVFAVLTRGIGIPGGMR